MVQAGEKFGIYEIAANDSGKLIVLSETSDSITIRGRHSQHGTPVAIKVVHHPGQSLEAFEEEARLAEAAAGLSHPHIARVLDFGADGDRLYRVIEWCEGGGISSYLNQLGDDAEFLMDLLQWFSESASALAYAHGQGIYHRDLKPSNVLIAREGDRAVIKLADFGFAGGSGAESGAPFAAPEPLGVKGSSLSDVYSLAAVFATLLEAEFSPGHDALFPTSVGSRWPSLLHPMLSEDPGDRPAHGTAVQQEIRAVFAGFDPCPVPWRGAAAGEIHERLPVQDPLAPAAVAPLPEPEDAPEPEPPAEELPDAKAEPEAMEEELPEPEPVIDEPLPPLPPPPFVAPESLPGIVREEPEPIAIPVVKEESLFHDPPDQEEEAPPPLPAVSVVADEAAPAAQPEPPPLFPAAVAEEAPPAWPETVAALPPPPPPVEPPPPPQEPPPSGWELPISPPPAPVDAEPSPWDAPAAPPAARAEKQSSAASHNLFAAIVVLILLSLAAAGGIVGWRRYQRSHQSPQVTPQDKAVDTVASKPVEPASDHGQTSVAKENRPPRITPPVPPVEADATTPSPDTKVAGDPAPPVAPPPAAPGPEAPKVVKIPGDATTISGAVSRCPSGGTIEIVGGSYRESVQLTRPVTITASGDASLEDDGKSPNLLIIRGDIAVKISGLTLKNAQKKGEGNPEETPALMLIASGAKVKMDKCAIEGGQGDGLTVADHGQAELSECRIAKNRGFGARISGGSSLTVTNGSIQENGLGGVWANNSGSRFVLGEGGNVNRNSNNGIQATEGAVVELDGGGVSFNRKNGIMALHAATRVEIKDASLVSDNHVNGIALVTGASAAISSAKIERNQNNGILAERSGKLTLSGAILRSNSLAGVFFNEGGDQSCRIERSEFTDHSQFGAAFVGGDIYVSGCTFSENGGALFLGKDTKGEVSGNTISPGPIDKAITKEETGTIREEKNTIR